MVPPVVSRKSKILHPHSMTFGCNCSRIFLGSGSFLMSWRRSRMSFTGFPLPIVAKWGKSQARWSSTRKEHPEQVIYRSMNWKLVNVVMWNWQATVVVSTQHPLKPPQCKILWFLSPKMLHIADSCFWMLPLATLSDPCDWPTVQWGQWLDLVDLS